MGVDGAVLSVNSKRYRYYDRDYNIYWFRNGVDFDDPRHDRCESILHRMRQGEEAAVTAEEVIFLMDCNIESWMKEPEDQQYHAYHCRAVKAFVQSFPDDRFFCETDSSRAYDLYGDSNDGTNEEGLWDGKYMSWFNEEFGA